MSTPTTSRNQGPDLDKPVGGIPLSHGTIPKFAPQATLLAAAVLGLVLNLTGMSIGLAAVLVAVLYAVVIYAWSASVEGGRKGKDRLITAVVYSAFLLALLPLISVVVTVVSEGFARFDAEFFSYSMRGVVGEGGGIYHALMGTLIITALAAVISVPIGMLCAIYLVEYGRGKLAKAITFFVDVMTGIPSIVAGLFAVALFTLFFGPGVRMGIMGSIALSVLMIPVVVRSTEEMLKLVPNELREAAYALAVPKWRMIVKVVLPTALAGIATGVTLAIARVIGETAPLLLTVGITSSVNLNPFDGRMATLSVFSYYEYVSPGVPPEPSLDRAWAAALLLIIIVMALNLVARVISRLFAPKTRG
ncbi:phosphate ABC transporter permease PstA [Amycolatopsis cihanbeyliensis]|uniref:Phosphate transport system permease protein PstA n=1 Tax=Amycolatopsis cihanbeyliensis TaxID=1128664 RepID=A0A542DK99_AMYCI|nr:phosphate ABC transporter permease PstA [Amycolatopsis cihanbeyliensis]TQJ03520.1 phosphate ABC transporter membrane protein 2 (PhoT family) [Amycolatopsis cihanbeyliensis]